MSDIKDGSRRPIRIGHRIWKVRNRALTFTLYERPWVRTKNWYNLKLEGRPGGFRYLNKWNWWLSWNGERMGHHHDAGLLAEHHPDIYAWVVRVLTSRLSRLEE